jgi:uncharacterized damage-inducible protein DinB
MATSSNLTGERADLLDNLAKRRHFLRFTVQGLTDAEANRRSTVSALTLAGLVKHVAEVEEGWITFAQHGHMPGSDEWSDGEWDGTSEPSPELVAAWESRFRLSEGETLAQQLERYAQVTQRTDDLIASGIDLDIRHPLPEAPWYAPGESWSVRQVLLHIIAETAQHSGHADIIRESIDGQKSMG